MAMTDPTSMRWTPELLDDICSVLGATGGAYNRRELVERACAYFIAVLRAVPDSNLLPGYDAAKDRAVTR